MNPDWLRFLTEQGATIANETILFNDTDRINTIHPLIHLGLFSVSGDDAASFLQGQLTCDIHEIADDKASPAAFCNAKGRVISTLIVCKNDNRFIAIVPHSLLQIVVNKLRMYILRSKVSIDVINDLFLLGLTTSAPTFNTIKLPETPFAACSEHTRHIVRLPGALPRYLMFAGLTECQQFWQDAIPAGQMSPGSSVAWRFQDISAGMPWFESTESEKYIPQMLNIDKLGGISFNKGCYTGQEIVARTHYLGKAKRELFLAEYPPSALITSDTTIIDRNDEKIGSILITQTHSGSGRCLMVLPVDSTEIELFLSDATKTPINLISITEHQ